MAKRPKGATLPILRVTGTHAELGAAMGAMQAAQIQAVVDATLAGLREQKIARRHVREQIAPYVEQAERVYPQYVRELRAMAQAADVPFDILFRLNCYESRPPGSGPPGPREQRAAPPVKDPGTMAQAGRSRAARWTRAAERMPALAGRDAPDGCTSVVSRGRAGVVVGHTEDSFASAVEGLYLLDATVTDAPSRSNGRAHRFLGLNYAQTLPGCAAAVNDHGLIVLIDALPDPERALGVPRHFASRALLDRYSIEDAVDHLRTTARGGGWNYVMVRGTQLANVETTATKVVVTELGPEAAYAHTNHYVDPELAQTSGEPRPNSMARLERALALVQPGMDVRQMIALLSDRQGFPDSICRDRTIGAFVADTARRQVQVCWGEPDEGTWTAYDY